MITGSPLTDALVFVVIGWGITFLFIPMAQWIDYKRNCKKHGKEEADEIRRRWR